MERILLQPIGVVHTRATQDEIRARVPGVESTVEVFDRFAEGLYGLEGFSHIFLLGYMHNLRPEQVGPLTVKPRGLLREGLSLEELPTLGVFALDSPTRPDPIGLSLVRLVKLSGNKLVVSGLDFFDGTPILDIKPYQGGYRVEEFRLPDWHVKLLKRAGHV